MPTVHWSLTDYYSKMMREVYRGYKVGEGGIRTPGTVARTQHFQCCTIDRSVTSPEDELAGCIVATPGVASSEVAGRGWGGALSRFSGPPADGES